jgi:hypothetical protein
MAEQKQKKKKTFYETWETPRRSPVQKLEAKAHKLPYPHFMKAMTRLLGLQGQCSGVVEGRKN